jgi:hypothetical protein
MKNSFHTRFTERRVVSHFMPIPMKCEMNSDSKAFYLWETLKNHETRAVKTLTLHFTIRRPRFTPFRVSFHILAFALCPLTLPPAPPGVGRVSLPSPSTFRSRTRGHRRKTKVKVMSEIGRLRLKWIRGETDLEPLARDAGGAARMGGSEV